jgi:high-affinity Fe2+/Pb2+ permease
MKILKKAGNAIIRIVVLLAGIPVSILGGYLVYRSFVSHTDSRFLSKIAWIILLVGLGMILYGFTGSEKPKEEAPGTGFGTNKPQP